MSKGYIWHVTLTTGHGEMSPRRLAPKEALAALEPVIRAALDGPTPVPDLPDVTLHITAAGPHCVATIANGRSGDPLVMMGIAPRSRGAGNIWTELHSSFAAFKPVTSVADVPAAPWCAVVPLPAILHRTDIALRLADLEQRIAWAWMEHVGR